MLPLHGWPGLAGATYGVPLADVLLSGLLEQALVVRNAVLAVDEAGEKVVSVMRYDIEGDIAGPLESQLARSAPQKERIRRGEGLNIPGHCVDVRG